MSNIEQRVEVTAPQKVYFNLELIHPAENEEPFASITSGLDMEMPTFEPGKAYQVRVWGSGNAQPGQKGVYIHSGMNLFLWAHNTLGITISNPRSHVARDDVHTFTHVFDIMVVEEIPMGDLTLELCYVDSEIPHHPRIATTMRVSLAGQHNLVSEELLEKCHVSLDVRPPDNVAILHIEAALEKQLRLTGWNCRTPSLSIAALDIPALDLGGFDETLTDPQTLRLQMRDFSANETSGLCAWLDRLRQKYGEDLGIIIVNHTEIEFPWEMLELADNNYLGALARIVHWLPVQLYGHRQDLQVAAETLAGAVMAYIDESATPEHHPLTSFIHHLYQTFAQLKVKMMDSLQSVGLVYLESKGIFTYENEQYCVSVDELHNPANRRVQLTLSDLPALPKDRPILFVNACHSARLVRGHFGLVGLPQALLARIASGFIGSLGPVNPAVAAKIAQKIFQEARSQTDGASLPEILRQLRAYAVQQVITNPSKQNQLLFIYTFMYIYYGNPMARLHLTVAEEMGDVHE